VILKSPNVLFNFFTLPAFVPLAQYGSVKGYAVLKTINTGGFIMIPVPLCLTCLERNFETGFLTTLGLFL
jgi:hypothetical protein